jgi:hypothetical protein
VIPVLLIAKRISKHASYFLERMLFSFGLINGQRCPSRHPPLHRCQLVAHCHTVINTRVVHWHGTRGGQAINQYEIIYLMDLMVPWLAGTSSMVHRPKDETTTMKALNFENEGQKQNRKNEKSKLRSRQPTRTQHGTQPQRQPAQHAHNEQQTQTVLFVGFVARASRS